MKSAAKLGARMRQDGSIDMPFIGLKIPFVCLPQPYVRPFIGYNKPSVKNHAFCGFTLIELIVTVVIAGILISIAAPSMANFVKNGRLTSQANTLMADLAFARSEAVKRGANVTVCRSSDSATCDTAAGSWATGWIVIDSTGQVLRAQEALDDVNTLTGTGGATGLADQLAYTSTGMADMTSFIGPQTFQLCDDRLEAYGKAIQVAVTGRARVDKTPPAGCF
ncbi:MAG: GspH/FimT family pseudopilin [Acidiferrobacterales bacterium]